MPNWIVGIDIGGTFTDVASMEVETGRLRVTKVPSIPVDPSQAVVSGLQSLFETDADIRPGDIEFFAHGTTVATNALIEGKGAKAGLLITRGFRAIYQLRGGSRPTGSDLIDSFYHKPVGVVPQRFTHEIGGRILFNGSEHDPLDEEDVRTAVRGLRREGVRSIAVCYLFSFMNPAHEQRTAEIIRNEHPDCRVSLSSLVLPVIREYQRLSTTALDAFVGPVVETYLSALSGKLREAGLTTERMFIMQSNGGLMRIDVAAGYPNQTLLSGPAAGVVFGSSLGEITGERNVVTFDMGGTSTDISVMPGGVYQETRQGKISDQDVGTPMIQIRTLGAGGGTIAWIGPDGLLKCGPRSAGASPGPACYGQGGTEPTITDANLVLGYLNPKYFIGGRITIDPRLSEQAISKCVAEPLGMNFQDAVLGIIRVVNVNMEVGLRLSFVEKGLDPRKFALVAFGGAGPLHASRVARNMGIPKVIVPAYPGISSAMGLLQTDVKHQYLQSRMVSLLNLSEEEANGLFDGLVERAREEARNEGFSPNEVELLRQLDLRYPYQGYELTITCPNNTFQEGNKQAIRNEFDGLHKQVYGTSAPEEVPEVVNVRVTSISHVPKLTLPEISAAGLSPEGALAGKRLIRFEEYEDYKETPVYRRAELLTGNRIEGPAIVEQLDSTTVILPRQSATVDRYGSLVIMVEG